ncbi:hypothetical protein CWE08_00005, partial [Aliidiomarina iranensis]
SKAEPWYKSKLSYLPPKWRLVDAFLAQVPTQITWLDILLKNVARLSGARSEVRILHASFLLSTAFEKFFIFCG